MNISSMILGGLLALLLIGFGVFLAVAIIFNLNVGRRYRQSLATEIDKLRLGKMLNALGIDVSSYLHNERIVDIEQQMKRCDDCGNTGACDDKLSAGTVDAAEISFCNNEQALRDMLGKKPTTN